MIIIATIQIIETNSAYIMMVMRCFSPDGRHLAHAFGILLNVEIALLEPFSNCTIDENHCTRVYTSSHGSHQITR